MLFFVELNCLNIICMYMMRSSVFPHPGWKPCDLGVGKLPELAKVTGFLLSPTKK